MKKWVTAILALPYVLIPISLVALRLEANSGNYSDFYPTFVVFWSSVFASILLTIALILRWIIFKKEES